MSQEHIALFMFASMMLMLFSGQRVFGAIGAIAAIAAIALWGTGGQDIPFSAAMKLMKWYPLLTLPMFIFMGYVLSESRLADDLYRMFHVWFGNVSGGLAMGTIGLMVLISAMNGLSVAGMAIGATIALPELLRRGYDKTMVTGVVQAGSSLGILVPPSVVLVLYAMIARQPVGQLWLAGVVPGLMMAAMFVIYIWIRCRINPALGPIADDLADVTREEKNPPSGCGCPAPDYLCLDDGAVRERLDIAGRKLGHWCAGGAGGVDPETPHDMGGVLSLHQTDLGHFVHVHVDHPCRPWVWRGV